MNSGIEIIFWASVGLVVYSYAIYPLILGLSRHRRRPWIRSETMLSQPISIVIAARDEEQRIVVCIKSLLGMMRTAGIDGEIVLVSDGSHDQTVSLVRDLNYPQVTVAEFQDHGGKAVALNRGVDLARHDIVVFADTRQTWDDGALPNLLQNFADPRVGAVSGELLLRDSDGALAGVGQYWKLEKWIRKQESLLHSCVGVTGAVSAVRRVLYQPVPAGTILDDVYWPMTVVMGGYRVVHDAKARVYDRLPSRRRDECLRKVRTLSGNYQLMWRLPSVLVPRRNPIWFAFVSHKLTRLLVPWALIAAFCASFVLAEPATVYRWLLVGQVVGYLVAVIGLCSEWASRSKVVAAASAFVLLNGACLAAMFVWLSGGIRSNWYRVQYDHEGSEVEQSR